MAATAHAGHLPGAFASGPQFPPSIMVPVEMYASLVSVNNLHQRLVYGPRGHEFLDLVRTIYALQPTGATSTAEESRHGWGRAAPPLRNDPRRAAADSGAVRHPAAGNSTPRPIHRALQRIRRRHERAKGTSPPRLQDMTHDAILRLDLELEGLHVAHLREKRRSSEEEPLPAPSREGFCATGESCPLDGESPPRDDAGAIAAVDPLDGESPPGDDTGATDEADPLDGESPPRDDIGAIDVADPLTPRDNTGAIDEADPLDGESLPGNDSDATDDPDPLDGESSHGQDTGATGESDPHVGEFPLLPGEEWPATGEAHPSDGAPRSPGKRVPPSPTTLLTEQADQAVREALQGVMAPGSPDAPSTYLTSSTVPSPTHADTTLEILPSFNHLMGRTDGGGKGLSIAAVDSGMESVESDYPLPDEVWRDYASKGGYYIPGALAPFRREVVWSACYMDGDGCNSGGYDYRGTQWAEKASVIGFLFAHLAPHAKIDRVDVGRLLDAYEHENAYISQPSFNLFWLDTGDLFRNTCTKDDAVHTFDVARELAPGPNAPDEGIRTNALDADRACHDPPPTKNRKSRSRSKKKKKKSKSKNLAHKRWSTGDADDTFFDAIDRGGLSKSGVSGV